MDPNLAESKANHRDFVKKIIAAENVWILNSEDGAAYCVSEDEGDDERSVIQFWAQAADAEQAAVEDWAEYETESVTLFDFLFRWLPGMHDDEALVGTNLSNEKLGLEIEPADLEEELRDAMGEKMIAKYEERLEKELANEKPNSKKKK